MPKRADVTLNVARVTDKTHDAAVDGLQLAAEHLLGVSRKQVPIERHDLEQSGRATVDASAMTAAVSYDTPYAVVQHENLSFEHDSGRKAKYLEDPAESERDTMQNIIAEQLRRAIG